MIGKTLFVIAIDLVSGADQYISFLLCPPRSRSRSRGSFAAVKLGIEDGIGSV
jgi:hypothetical protein